MNKRLGSLLAAASLSVLAACATTPTPAPLAESLKQDPQLSTFNRLVDQAGLRAELNAAGPLTVFAPNDDAFKAVPAKTLEALAADPAQLKAVLNFHVVPAKVDTATLQTASVKSVQGAPLALSRAGAYVTVEDAMVQKNLPATNGVALVIDRVLMPPKK